MQHRNEPIHAAIKTKVEPRQQLLVFQQYKNITHKSYSIYIPSSSPTLPSCLKGDVS